MLTWNQIEGQDGAQEVLMRALESNRVHHAYLFAGPTGVGKRATALAFAGAMNCERRADGTFEPGCGECASCRKLEKLQHPDLHLVEPSGGGSVKTTKIEQVRDVQKAASTRPYEAKYQVVIFDDAHLMTQQAANALLKTLEEPPETMRLVLVTDQPHSLLDTIRSRCQLVRFGALERELVIALLRQTLEGREGDDALPSDEVLSVAAGFAEGSVGRALSILDSGILEDRRDLVVRLDALDEVSSMALLDLAQDVAKDRSRLEERLDVLKVFYRDVMVFKATGTDERVVNHDLLDLVQGMAKKCPQGRVLRNIEHIREAQEMLRRNVNPLMIVEDLLTHLRAPELSATS